MLCATRPEWSCNIDKNRAFAQPGHIVMMLSHSPNAQAGQDVTSPEYCPNTVDGAVQKPIPSVIAYQNDGATDVSIYTITSGGVNYIQSKPVEERHKYVGDFNWREHNSRLKSNSLTRDYLVIPNLCPRQDGGPSFMYLIPLLYPMIRSMEIYRGMGKQTVYVDHENMNKLNGYVQGLQKVEKQKRAIASRFTASDNAAAGQTCEEYATDYGILPAVGTNATQPEQF